jgi:hypothetical protein
LLRHELHADVVAAAGCQPGRFIPYIQPYEIVRDMWLTGFDAPCCHTMYVDKPMKGHNLMQAIARVNRVFKNKPGGLVVDYIGIANELKAALKTYTEAKGKGNPTHNAAEALAVLLEKMDIVRGMMHGCDYSGFETKAAALLVPCANHLLGLKGGKQRFLDTMVAVAKAYSLCGTLDEATALRKEIAFFSAIKAAITKFTTVDNKRSTEEKNSALKQIPAPHRWICACRPHSACGVSRFDATLVAIQQIGVDLAELQLLQPVGNPAFEELTVVGGRAANDQLLPECPDLCHRHLGQPGDLRRH